MDNLAEDQDPVMSGFKVLSGTARMKMLPSISPTAYLKLEMRYCNIMAAWVPSYSGGHHEFIEFPNGAKAPLFDITNDEMVDVECADNYYVGKMTYRAASLAAFIVASNHLGWQLHNAGLEKAAEPIFNNYRKLMDVAYEHEMFSDETSALFKLLD